MEAMGHINGETAETIKEALEKGRITVDQVIRRLKEVSQKQSYDCQRVISEGELEGFLTEGWEVKAILASGRIVVEK